jgi:hypothetical protein
MSLHCCSWLMCAGPWSLQTLPKAVAAERGKLSLVYEEHVHAPGWQDSIESTTGGRWTGHRWGDRPITSFGLIVFCASVGPLSNDLTSRLSRKLNRNCVSVVSIPIDQSDLIRFAVSRGIGRKPWGVLKIGKYTQHMLAFGDKPLSDSNWKARATGELSPACKPTTVSAPSGPVYVRKTSPQSHQL